MAKIDLDLIQQLRNRTGAGMMDCKKALEETNSDIEKAIDVLRKKGAATAAKRAGNTTGEGLIHAYIHPGSRIGVMVEINCETDFVARTQDMINFANDVCLHIAAMKPLFVNTSSIDPAYREKEERFFTEQLAGSGKPAAIIQQIVEGKLQKMYAEVCLLNQPFVKNDKLTVEEMLKELIGKLGENIKINRFARFEIGM